MILQGNNIETLKKYPDNYFDSIVTDPPYGLSFMGKKWDYDVPSVEFWKEAFRVLKYGGHLLSFSGTRTYHRMVVNIEDAGFEIRDQIQWIYGSGFPKSYNVAKGIEGKITKGSSSWNKWQDLDGDKEERKLGYTNVNFTTKEAKDWDGWGSALKPANEPICLARKPLEKGKSIADNVLKYGTGGINIDASRVGTQDKTQRTNNGVEWGNRKDEYYEDREKEVFGSTLGRFPANVILTHHPDCVCKGTNFSDENGEETIENWECVDGCPIKLMDEQSGTVVGIDKGGASRFFYCAKASISERNKGLVGFEPKQMAWSNQAKAELKRGNTEFADKTKMHNKVQERINFHPTVKPIKLMQYLVRMVTPPNGIVLDPFCGSGTTGVACIIEGFNFVGCEMDAEYCKIAEARITNYVVNEEKKSKTNNNDNDKEQLKLF